MGWGKADLSAFSHIGVSLEATGADEIANRLAWPRLTPQRARSGVSILRKGVQ